jgi:hypothetical protein
MEAAGLKGRCTWRKGGWIHGGEGRRLSRAAMEWGARPPWSGRERVTAITVEKKRCVVEELAAAMRMRNASPAILSVDVELCMWAGG